MRLIWKKSHQKIKRKDVDVDVDKNKLTMTVSQKHEEEDDNDADSNESLMQTCTRRTAMHDAKQGDVNDEVQPKMVHEIDPEELTNRFLQVPAEAPHPNTFARLDCSNTTYQVSIQL